MMRSLRGSICAIFVAAFGIVFLSGCGGSSGTAVSGLSGTTGGTETTGGAGAAGASVRVSMASAPQSPGTLSAPSSGSLAPGGGTVLDIDHVWITVTGVALIPGTFDCTEFEEAGEGDGIPHAGALRTAISPMTVDLLDLSHGTAAILLNQFDNVPAGTYGKVRIYYRDPKFHVHDALDNTPLHTTANGHLDVHFVGGDLVVPVTTDQAGTRFHDVTVNFVLGRDGLKITRAGKSGKYIMRPQVFATAGEVEYVVSGTVSNFDNLAGTFNLTTAAPRTFPVQYDGLTGWFYRDGALWVPVSPLQGVAAMRNGATVDVLGNFTVPAPNVLQANDILVSFPDRETGSVWPPGFLLDDTLLVFNGTDNVVIVPEPDRASAYYDGLGEAGITGGVDVDARGYRNLDGSLGAYWITVEGVIVR